MPKSPSPKKERKMQLKTFIFNFFEKDKEYRHATESNPDMTKSEFSHLLFKTILRILVAFDRKSEKLKFFQAVFSVLNEQKISDKDISLYMDQLYEQLEFFDQQTLNTYLTYYLHNEPKGSVYVGMTFRHLLKEMIQHGITNNRMFLSKGTHLAEQLSRNLEEQEVLKNVMQAIIFQKDIHLDLPNLKKSLSKKELLIKLEECERKLMKLNK